MKNEMRIVTKDDAEFPALLREIPDAPEQLYVQGNLAPLRQDSAGHAPPENVLLAVVGSRAYTSYGKAVVEHLLSGLRGYPVTIVSGLALGMDALAHKAALANGLHTVGVPGSGLSDKVLYPRSNFLLAQEILAAGGGLLSEQEPEQGAALWTFPKRNRIMAGMCHATLLIEAKEKSGTLITARLASEYNRDVFVVPGDIFSSSTKGTHQFLKLGATPITSAADLLDALNLQPQPLLYQGSPGTVAKSLTADEQKVAEILQTPCSRDELIEQLGLPITQANILLSAMELKGLIKEELGVLRMV